jgi:hypothetical protein
MAEVDRLGDQQEKTPSEVITSRDFDLSKQSEEEVGELVVNSRLEIDKGGE